MKDQIGHTPEFANRWNALIGQLEYVNHRARMHTPNPTEMAEAVSLARYRLEQVAELLGCAQAKPLQETHHDHP